MFRFLRPAGYAAVGLICTLSHADAAIVCEGDFQIVDGLRISTPYCQDENLAAELRKKGVAVSGQQVRRSAEVKQQACVSAAAYNDPICAQFWGD
jgi:hypothetical protein